MRKMSSSTVRRGLAGSAVAAALVAGCSQPVVPEPVAGPTRAAVSVAPEQPRREGPAPSWSVPADLGHQVSEVGDTLVVSGQSILRGLDRTNGRELWQQKFDGHDRYWIAGGLVVLAKGRNTGSTTAYRVEVIDPATGTTRWKADRESREIQPHQDAVYLVDCRNVTDVIGTGCSLTSREVRTGATRWRVPTDGPGGAGGDAVGLRPPYAPAPTGRYVAARIREFTKAKPWAAIDRTTGKALPGRVEHTAWPVVLAGRDLVALAPDEDDKTRCSLGFRVTDLRTGARAWSATAYSGRRANRECERLDPSGRQGPAGLTGAGTRIVTRTAAGVPQSLDLATGRTGWRATVPGIPVDATARAVLIRDFADAGKLSVLDLATGRLRWTAPDPGPPEQGWYATVTDRLVAVGVERVGDQQHHVIAYDVNNGRRLGLYPGRLAGAGNGWLAVTRVDGQLQRKLDLIRF